MTQSDQIGGHASSPSVHKAATRGKTSSHCVPASPPNPATPEHHMPKEVAWLLQKISIADCVQYQVNPLHSCFDEEQRSIALLPNTPA